METKQKVYLDENNKLVVITDNAVIDGYNKATTSLDGEFTISAGDVAKLLSMINEKNIFSYDTLNSSYRKWFIGDASELTHQIECEIKLREEVEKVMMEKNLEYRQIYRERTSLITKINDFNETRHWWERKLKY